MTTQVIEVGTTKRMQYAQACVVKYFEWMDAGHCPSGLDDVDALIHWDQHENGSSLLEYDHEINYRRGIREQARLILLTYTRRSVTGAWGKVTVPGVVRLPKSAQSGNFTLQRLSQMPKSEVELIVIQMKTFVKAKTFRLLQLGAHPRQIQNALKEAEQEAVAEFQKGR